MIRLRKALLSNYLYLGIVFFIAITTLIRITNHSIKPYQDKIFQGIIVEKTSTYLVLKNNYKVIAYHQDLDHFALGDKVKIVGTFDLPKQKRNINGFNYKNYLLSKKIYYLSYKNKINLISKNKNFFFYIKNKITTRINSLPNTAYLYAFILGTGKLISEDVNESYRYNGLSHLLAISGAQVSLFAGFILFIFRNRKESTMYLMAVLTAVFITFLAGFTPSMNRAMIAFILISINIIYYLHIKSIHLWFLTISINLIFNPFDIYNIGFWYSYVITFFLILKKEYPKGIIGKAITISWISTLASAPISLSTFYSINLLGVLYNLFYVPYVSFIIYPGILLSFIFKPVGFLIKPFINFFEYSSILLANLNGLTITSGRLPVILMILIYFCLIIYIKYKFHLYLLFIIVIILLNNLYLNNQNNIYFIDIGQGDSTFIKYKHTNILIDTGEDNGYNHQTIISFLKSINVSKLDYLIITHGDSDHIGNAKYLLTQLSVKKVILNQGDLTPDEAFIKTKYPNKITGKTSLKWLKIMYLEDNQNENDNSIAILINFIQLKLLMMGDLTSKYEDHLIEKYNITNIDYLKISHHGSKRSTSNYLIKKLNPKYSFISVGLNNRFNHPHQDVLYNLKNSKIYRTDLMGGILIKITKQGYTIHPCNY